MFAEIAKIHFFKAEIFCIFVKIPHQTVCYNLSYWLIM